MKISFKYLDFVDEYLFKWAIELPKNMSINKYTIILKKLKQPLYWLIYSQTSIELKISKSYIKTHLKTGSI